MSVTAEATLDLQDPDSLDDEAQEPTGEVPDEPSPIEDAADDDEPSAAADADAAGQPDAEGAAADGPARDEHGRFVSTKEAPAEIPSPPIADAPPPAPATPAAPFSFGVDGRRVDAEGATVVNGEIRIPQATWERVVQPRLADRGRHKAQVDRLLGQIDELKADKGEKEARAEILLGRVDEMLKDRAKLIEFVNNFDREAPKLQLEVQNKILQQRLERTTKRVETDSERGLSERLTQNARPAIENAVAQILEGIEGVDAQEAADEIEALWEAGTPIFFKVQPNDPSGLDPAEDPIGVDVPRIARLLQRTIDKAKRTAAEKKAAEVRARNAVATGRTPQPKPPATVPTKGSPVPGGEERKFQSAEEYDEYIRNKYKVPSSRS